MTIRFYKIIGLFYLSGEPILLQAHLKFMRLSDPLYKFFMS